MRVAVIGLGTQGRKRVAVAGESVSATVDPVVASAQYRALEAVPLDDYSAALVCTPDDVKFQLLQYLLRNKKHVLVEKPLLFQESGEYETLENLARTNNLTCYTAYNHRFEPHLAAVQTILAERALGNVYLLRMSYGNGTARDVRNSVWRDKGMGVLADLGSHLLDLSSFLLGGRAAGLRLLSLHSYENRASDYVLFSGSIGQTELQCEATLLSWKNTFTLDVIGELGSVHVQGLCKWGPSTLVKRTRKFPSGKPLEEEVTLQQADPTWKLEYAHFQDLCLHPISTLENDRWIASSLWNIAEQGTIT